MRPAVRRLTRIVAALAFGLAGHSPLVPTCARAETVPPPGLEDSRVRVAAYDPSQVYRLYGFVGYQIDLQFSSAERFVGLGAGDVEALSFVSERNHLFLKPKARRVATNITVLTTTRTYQFRYTAAPMNADTDLSEVIYALRFRYPPSRSPAAALQLDRRIGAGDADSKPNYDYWYCGDPTLKPAAAWDDGVHTRLRFGAHAEMPAIFVRNDDGSESLLNFSIDDGVVILHRIAKRFVLRRGRLTGCVVNESFHGSGVRLKSGTIAPDVLRVPRGGGDARR